MKPTLLLTLALLPVAPGVAAQQWTPALERLEQRLSVGSATESDVVLDRVRDAHLDGNRIWILELHQILVLDSDGRPQNSFGRNGAGPGEFLLATRFVFDSLITVYDSRLGRATILDREGSLVGTRPIDLDAVGGAGLSLPLTSGRWLSVSTPRFTTQQSSHDPFANLILVHETQRDTLASLRASEALWARDGSYGIVPTPAGNGGAWTLSPEGDLVVVDGYDGWVRWFCAPDFQVCDEQELGLSAKAFGRAEVAWTLDRLEEKEGVRSRPEVLVETPPRVSVGRDAVTDRRTGRIWIQSDGDFAGGTRYLVVDRVRGVVDRIVFRNPVRLRDVGPFGILATTLGEFDETILLWYVWRESR